MADKPINNSTIARIAGNIAGRLITAHIYDPQVVATEAVQLARAIVAEVERADPSREQEP